jgi:adenine phosphoribosyltransferase
MNEGTEDLILSESIREIENFPIDGVVYKDITTLLNNPKYYKALLNSLESRYADRNIDYIAGIDSRGFIFGAALADRLSLGFVPIRKKGKLPHDTYSESYDLEYGADTIEIHKDAFNNDTNAKVLLIDDLIATGGTAIAAHKLIEKTGAECVGACFILEVSELPGKTLLSGICSEIHIEIKE